MPSRPRRSGASTTICRSKRPGRSSAGIEHVGTVRRGDQDHAVVRLEAVHLDEQLIERLLTLVVTAAKAGAAMAADGVDLVDEDDARRVCLALLEQIAHAARADAHEHLDEVGTRHREERTSGFAGDRLREQRLTRSRRTDEQRTLRQTSAELGELLRIAQELDDFLKLLLRFVGAGDVGERDLRRVAREQLRLRFAERERLGSARLHLLEQEQIEADEQQPRHEVENPRRHGDARRPSRRSRRSCAFSASTSCSEFSTGSRTVKFFGHPARRC